MQNSVIIFLGVSSLNTLKDRFLQRKDDRDGFRRRMRQDYEEWVDNKSKFPNIVINNTGKLDEAVDEIYAIVEKKQQELKQERKVQ